MLARLLEWAMQTNHTIALAKVRLFGQNIALELDYRAEHVDEAVLANLVSLVHSLAEVTYPKVLAIVGAPYGLAALPKRWVEGLDGREWIDAAIRACTPVAETR
jgi:hypothetical protein